MGPATRHHVTSAVLTIQSRVSARILRASSPCRISLSSQRPARGSAHLREGKWRETQTRLLCTEAFIGEGSEFMDHRQVQIESSENAAGAGAWQGGCGRDGLPGSPGALVPVP